MTLQIRARRPEDVPLVCDLLMRQQPVTRYPLRNPLPFPVEDFVVRRGELAAWVAELDGRVAGHLSVLAVGPGPLGDAWSAAVGRPVAELAEIAVLVVDHTRTGRGAGRALLDTGEAWIRDRRRAPVLEVLGAHSRAARVYAVRGWRVVGTARPAWLPDGEDDVDLMALLD